MNKRSPLMFSAFLLAWAAFLTLSHSARASDGVFDIDPKFRAKMAKDRAQQASLRSQSANPGTTGFGAECANINTGNVGPSGRPAAPGQVFDAAPTTVNITSAQGCK